jgi:TDG/mug DNA glycosylase family protein
MHRLRERGEPGKEVKMSKRRSRTEKWVPTRAEIAAAVGKVVPDVIAPNLKVLFVGINPGLYSGAVAHHFARPGNRFWPALHLGGFTDGVLSPFDEARLLERGYGVTNIVDGATCMADELTAAQLRAGARKLVRKVKRYRPKIIGILGITSYRTAFERPEARVGRQEEPIGETIVWLLPNPSGLNAHFQVKDLGKLFRELRKAAEDCSR